MSLADERAGEEVVITACHSEFGADYYCLSSTACRLYHFCLLSSYCIFLLPSHEEPHLPFYSVLSFSMSQSPCPLEVGISKGHLPHILGYTQ
ncbi:hypothetical protein XENOCAPTIV_028143 [Xenoophorus captivus]|uniref:Uncharacterized protein n=1 Tax=Xenoophorus captivus TaxID=1517983 RepID=A0ABV0S123_9TELE